MQNRWYIEAYGPDGVSPETSAYYDSYDEAFDAVKLVRADGRIARFIAPDGATAQQVESFYQLGVVEGT